MPNAFRALSYEVQTEIYLQNGSLRHSTISKRITLTQLATMAMLDTIGIV